MKRMNFPLILLFIAGFSFTSLKAKDDKPTNYYKTPKTIETDNYQIKLLDIVSRQDFVKLAISIKNTGNDYLVYKPEETVFSFDFGNYNPQPRYVFINPEKSKKRTLKVAGGKDFLQNKFTVEPKGLYILPAKGVATEAESFQLPADKNNIEIGNFSINLLKVKKQTKETYAIFECTYKGKDVAIVNPSKINVGVENKPEIVYANDAKKSEDKLMYKGDKFKFKAVFHIPGKIVDMQFATLLINWNDTFSESKLVPLEVAKTEIVIDKGMTAAKSK